MRRGRGGLAVVLAAVAVTVSACGSSEPEPLTAMQPDVPADLCADLPADARTGLQTASTTDTEGDPVSACSLRSTPGAKSEVRAVVTWLQLNDDSTADGVLDSQCRSIDKTVYSQASSAALAGADKSCAASGKLGKADAATLAAVMGRTVITVRWSSMPTDGQPPLTRSTAVAQSLVAALDQAS